MSFNEVVRKTWEQNILFSVLVELTYRCNLNCYFCYNDLGLKGKPLDREQYFHLFEDLAGLQVFNLILTGGEPLSHPDFFALGRQARELGFAIRLKTNGHAAGSGVAKRLKSEVDPFLVEISLHGAKAATHERQTRIPGSFKRLLENLQHMIDAGLRIRINSTLTAWNEDEIEGMFELAETLGLPIHIDPIVTPRDDGDSSPLQIAASREAVTRLLELQRQRAQAMNSDEESPQGSQLTVGREADELMPKTTTKHCGAGSSGLAIDPFGNVYPCVQWRQPIGNLHDSSIRQLWEGSPALTRVRSLNQDVKERLDAMGPSGRGLNFCPGQAVLETGSPLELYPGAKRRGEILHGSTGQKKPTLLPIIDGL